MDTIPYRLLNTPEPLPVKEDAEGRPIHVGRGKLPVAGIEDHWFINNEWRRIKAVSRMYYAVVWKNGMRMVIYKDLISNLWYRQTMGKTYTD